MLETVLVARTYSEFSNLNIVNSEDFLLSRSTETESWNITTDEVENSENETGSEE
jgi:hypothetical protein